MYLGPYHPHQLVTKSGDIDQYNVIHNSRKCVLISLPLIFSCFQTVFTTAEEGFGIVPSGGSRPLKMKLHNKSPLSYCLLVFY